MVRKTKPRKLLSLGKSNDRDPCVKIEIRAAALVSGARSRKIERYGMAVYLLDCEGIPDKKPRPSARSRAEIDAGWLSSEIRAHDDQQGALEAAASCARGLVLERFQRKARQPQPDLVNLAAEAPAAPDATAPGRPCLLDYVGMLIDDQSAPPTTKDAQETQAPGVEIDDRFDDGGEL